MNGQVRRDRSNHLRDAKVLNQHRIHRSQCEAADDGLESRQFVGERQSIESHVAFDAAAMQELHDLTDAVEIKVCGTSPSIEAVIQTEIDRVRSILNRRANAIPVACRRK